VISAGTAAFEGGKASANAIEVLREEGFDLSSHISETLTREMLEEADIVVALDTEHVDYIKNWMPHLLPKVILIRPEGIKDPMGQPIEVYRNTANLIRHALPRIVEIALGGDEK
jgi:protein-tyrosine-phosphatase